MHNYGQYATAAAVTAGLVGGAYYLYFSRKTRLPSEWRCVGTIKSIEVYPIKSCSPIRVDKVECTILGPKNGWLRDRVLMIVDKKNKFITGRVYPELVLTKTAIKGSILSLTHPKMQESLEVDLAEVAATAKPQDAVVWGVTVPVFDCGAQAAEWFTRLLNRSEEDFKLVYYATQKPRKLKLNHNHFKLTKSDTSAFGDEVSFSLMNETSVLDLNTRLQNCQVSPRLFRANFLLQGAQPYEEDNWRFIKIGNNVFEIIKPCLRCLMTVIEPETGVSYAKNEPFEVLKGYVITYVYDLCSVKPNFYRYREIEDPVVRRATGYSPRLGLQMALRSGPGGYISQDDDVYVA